MVPLVVKGNEIQFIGRGTNLEKKEKFIGGISGN
jgi:hypothetical protein